MDQITVAFIITFRNFQAVTCCDATISSSLLTFKNVLGIWEPLIYRTALNDYFLNLKILRTNVEACCEKLWRSSSFVMFGVSAQLFPDCLSLKRASPFLISQKDGSNINKSDIKKMTRFIHLYILCKVFMIKLKT